MMLLWVYAVIPSFPVQFRDLRSCFAALFLSDENIPTKITIMKTANENTSFMKIHEDSTND